LTLLDRLSAIHTSTHASIYSESPLFAEADIIPTDLPILNVAFSGSFDGGLVSGVTVFAGLSKSYKTLLGLYCLKAYLDKYSNAVGLIFDSEFSVTPAYLNTFGVNPDRILHIPIEHIEQLKFDIMKRLNSIEEDDKVFILIDSLGILASKKEIEDALDEKSVADMTRAKAIRSLLRMITPIVAIKKIPCVIVNHVYQTMELYSKTVVGGGTAIMNSPHQVFIITKSQEKDKESNELLGWHFTINIEKSRFVREKSKFSFYVSYEGGIHKYSGLFDLAIASGNIEMAKKGFYQIKGDSKNRRRTDIENDDTFWEGLIKLPEFSEFVTNKYRLK